jgi:hypothetical protein
MTSWGEVQGLLDGIMAREVDINSSKGMGGMLVSLQSKVPSKVITSVVCLFPD